jgi:hypothetical protein
MRKGAAALHPWGSPPVHPSTRPLAHPPTHPPRQAAEQAALEALREEEQRKAARERRVLEQQSRALLKLPGKKERSAVAALEAVLAQERQDAAAREARHKLTVDRLRRQAADLAVGGAGAGAALWWWLCWARWRWCCHAAVVVAVLGALAALGALGVRCAC